MPIRSGRCLPSTWTACDIHNVPVGAGATVHAANPPMMRFMSGATAAPSTGFTVGAAPTGKAGFNFGASAAFGNPTTSTFGAASAPGFGQQSGGLFGGERAQSSVSRPSLGGGFSDSAGFSFGAAASSGCSLGSAPGMGLGFGSSSTGSAGCSFGAPVAGGATSGLFGMHRHRPMASLFRADCPVAGAPAAAKCASGSSIFGAAAATSQHDCTDGSSEWETEEEDDDCPKLLPLGAAPG